MLPFRQPHFTEAAGDFSHVQPGIVDQHIDTVMIGEYCLSKVDDLLFIRHVNSMDRGCCSQVIDQRLGFRETGFVDVKQDEMRALSCKGERMGAAQSGGSARYDDRFTGKSLVHAFLSQTQKLIKAS